nr:sulfatase-like hydrolase/transferase [Micromonospora sp. DSM 115978]
MTDPPRPPDRTGPGGTGGEVDRRRRELLMGLEILALCGLVITQPLLDVTGRSPDFFLFHGARAGDVLLLVALVALVPPALLWGAGALAGLAGPAVRTGAHIGTVGVLVAALTVQVGKHLLPVRGVPLLLLATAVGTAGGYAYRRWRVPGQILRVAAAGPLVFVMIFVFASPSSAVVLPRSAPDAAVGGGPGDTAHPPVVMLVLDEFPLVSLLDEGGAIDAERYPNIARLAGASTWYRNATGVSGWTPYALPAMLTGRYPAGERAPHYSQYEENLFTAFGADYEVRARETISQLCPPSVCPDGPARGSAGGLWALLRESGTLLREIVSPYDSDRDPETAYRETTRREADPAAGGGAGPTAAPAPTDPRFRWGKLDENQPARFTDFLAELRPTERPTLHFLHLLLPHSPWNYLPSGVRYESAPAMSNDGDGWVSLAYQRHLAQVEYTDRLVGQTLTALEESGLYDEALVVLTADHGVSFTPGVQGRSTEAVRRSPAEVLWVPTFVKAPGQRAGVVDDRNWEHVDLLPTVAELAGVSIPWRMDGVSGLAAARDRVDKRYHDEPDNPLDIPGPATFAAITAGRGGPVLPPAPLPELVGRTVTDLPVTESGGPVTVTNLGEYAEIDPDTGRLPALVYGTVPGRMPDGTALAVAVNGRIAAVTRVVAPDPEGRRFAALLPDESLFTAGANQVEIFEVADGPTLHRLAG